MAAAVFAVGATMQSSAVGRAMDAHQETSTSPDNVVGGRAMVSLLRNPTWLASVGVIVLGGCLHAVGLALAPISIVQPVGVLAIPFAILITARRRRQAPAPTVTAAVSVTMLAVLAFVLAAASDGKNAERIDAAEVAWSAVGVGTLALALAVVGWAGPRWARCLGWSSAGAMVYGLASALLRTDTMLIAQGELWTWPVLAYSTAVLLGFALGGWLIQHGHASGPPAVVLGSLTVVDPIVAVLFGIAFLGEGTHLAPLHIGVMSVSAVVAAAGVLVLARHHPETDDTARRDDVPSEVPSPSVRSSASREEHTP